MNRSASFSNTAADERANYMGIVFCAFLSAVCVVTIAKGMPIIATFATIIFAIFASNKSANDINDSSIRSQDKLAEKIRNSAEETIVAGNVKKISSEVLRELYGTDKKLIIECDGYDIYLNGCDISNAENELFTELDFTETDKGIMLSQSEQYRLPGKISIKLRNSKSDYKYFYMCSNDGKSLRKLNALSGDNTFSINSAGDYLLTTERAESFRINIVWVLGAAGVIILMSVVYIFTKRKYWFW